MTQPVTLSPFAQRLFAHAQQLGNSGSGGGAQGASAARPARRSRPPVLTGGESFEGMEQGAKVDWLTCTYLPEPDEHPGLANHQELLSFIGPVMAEECAGMMGYAYGCRYYVPVNGVAVSIGRCDWGGDNKKGRARFDLSGTGCAKVKDWAELRAYLESLQEPVLTRVDLAVDCLKGEYSVEDAVEWYVGGEFNAGGRNPRHSMPGDWLAPHYGRTLEIGRRTNGKMMRAYEKGRQLGDPNSPWVRFEVELRNIDRDIPMAILTDPDRYFVGAYKCLERILDVAGERIATHQAEGQISTGALVQHARASYGQLVDCLRVSGLSIESIIDQISRPGVPRRLEKATLSEFIEARRRKGLTQERQVAA